MAAALVSALDAVHSYTGAVAWGPLIRYSRSTILALLKSIDTGQLTVRERDGTVTVCGKTSEDDDATPTANLTVSRETFWLRLALFADMVSLGLSYRCAVRD